VQDVPAGKDGSQCTEPCCATACSPCESKIVLNKKCKKKKKEILILGQGTENGPSLFVCLF
jgi:hypothetical protein